MKNKLQIPQKNRTPFAKALIQLLLLPALIILMFTQAYGQEPAKEKTDYAIYPVWIKMMDNPNANYYEARKAFDEYFKHHKMPASEEEEMSEGKKDAKELERETKREVRKDQKKKLSEEELKEITAKEQMKYQVKRFKQWMREMKPFVQEDGRILTDQERIEIWNKQQEEIKKQQK